MAVQTRWNLVFSSKAVNAQSNRVLREAGLKLLSIPRVPNEPSVMALIRNAHGVAEWNFPNE
jgi:hypothetical protein